MPTQPRNLLFFAIIHGAGPADRRLCDSGSTSKTLDQCPVVPRRLDASTDVGPIVSAFIASAAWRIAREARSRTEGETSAPADQLPECRDGLGRQGPDIGPEPLGPVGLGPV